MIVILLGGAYVFLKKANADTTPPVISMDTMEIECPVAAEEEELLKGITVTDDKDGDLTNRVMVNDIRIKDNSEPGNRLFDVSYVVFDSSNNMATAKRTLKYTDYHPTRFHLDGELVFNSVTGVNITKLLTAEDCIDGDISSQIMLELDDAYLNAISSGEYTCIASVTNSVGDTASIPLPFEVQETGTESDDSKPILFLKEYLVYVKKGEDFNSKQYLDEIKVDNTFYTIKNKAEIPGIDVLKSIMENAGIKNSKDLEKSGDLDLYTAINEVAATYNLRLYEYGYSVEGEPVILSESIKANSDVDTATPGVYNVVFSYKHPEEGIKGRARLTVVVEE